MIVFDQSWTKTRDLTDFSCKSDEEKDKKKVALVDDEEPAAEPEPSGKRRREAKDEPVIIVGGYKGANLDDPEIKEMASYAATEIAKKTSKDNSPPRPLKVVKITSAQTQVTITIIKMWNKIIKIIIIGGVWDQLQTQNSIGRRREKRRSANVRGKFKKLPFF